MVQTVGVTTQPYLNLKPNFLPPDAEGAEYPGVELAIRGDHHWLKDAWQRLFKPHLDVFAAGLEPILTHHIQQAHLLLRAAGKADDHWDPFSYGRSAIESHPQDRYGEGPEILIDAARDVIEWILTHTPERARTVLDTWRDSNIRLLQRLSIHGITESPLLSAGERLGWIQHRNWLYTNELQHEVFRLLARAYPEASEAQRLAILEQVSQGPEGPDAEGLNEELRQYLTYQLLYWLHVSAPACLFAAEKFEAMQRAHPDFQPREHPDFTHWWGLTVGGPESLVTVDELLQKRPEEAIDWLLDYQGENLTEAAAKSFAWSWQLAQALRSRVAWSSELWRKILSGWYNSPLTENQWNDVLVFLSEHSELYTFAHSIADLLQNGAVKEQGRIPLASLPLAQTVAQALWDVYPGDALSEETEVEWLGKAINYPGGKLVEFWLSALSYQCLEAGENWTGIPDTSKRFLQKVLTEPTPSAQLGRVILASRLYFLFTLEADWTRASILPLLGWSLDTTRAEQAWHGFLTRGQWNEALLAELMPFYQNTYTHTAQLGRLRSQFSSHLADIALFSSYHPLKGAWFDNFLLTVLPEDRKSWAGHIRHRLRSLPENAIANVWARWMRRYWDRRITGTPIPLGTGELEQMTEWALHLGHIFPQAVEKICRGPAPHFEHQFIFYQLAETDYATTHPEALAQLLQFLLPAAQQPFYECDSAEKLVRSLVASPTSIRDLERLCNELARLGCPHAAEIRALLRKPTDP